MEFVKPGSFRATAYARTSFQCIQVIYSLRDANITRRKIKGRMADRGMHVNLFWKEESQGRERKHIHTSVKKKNPRFFLASLYSTDNNQVRRDAASATPSAYTSLL